MRYANELWVLNHKRVCQSGFVRFLEVSPDHQWLDLISWFISIALTIWAKLFLRKVDRICLCSSVPRAQLFKALVRMCTLREIFVYVLNLYEGDSVRSIFFARCIKS